MAKRKCHKRESALIAGIGLNSKEIPESFALNIALVSTTPAIRKGQISSAQSVG
jgi:hypothetical protein